MKEPTHTAILVKMGNLIGRVSLGNGEQLRSIHSGNLDDAMKKLESYQADVVVINETVESSLPQSCVELFRERDTDFRVPVIVVHLGLPPHQLMIHEWDDATNGYATRLSTPKKLSEEIERLCFKNFDWKQYKKELREIGFASNLDQGARSFHIQTEVMTARGIKIKTTIHSGGTVVESKVSEEPNPGRDGVTKVQRIAEEQHNTAVAEVRQGMYENR